MASAGKQLIRPEPHGTDARPAVDTALRRGGRHEEIDRTEGRQYHQRPEPCFRGHPVRLAVVVGLCPHQTASAWISAALIALVAGGALAQLHQWEEWVNAFLGLWVAVSPWLLGFAGIASAMWTHLVVGIAVVALAAYELRLLADENRPTTI